MLPWVWPLLLVGAAPVHGYLARKVRMSSLGEGVRPRFRRDLMLCWMSITVIAMLWTVGMVTSGLIQHNWQVLMFLWGSLYCVGYVINGVLLSREWLWVAGALLASLVAAFLAGPDLYWLPGFWIGGTLVMAGLMGRRNALRQSARTA